MSLGGLLLSLVPRVAPEVVTHGHGLRVISGVLIRILFILARISEASGYYPGMANSHR